MLSERRYADIKDATCFMRRALTCIAVSLTALFLSACRSEKANPALFELVENTGVKFENKVTDGPLENSFLFRNFYNGGGVAIGDLNNDSLPDLFFTSNMGENKIYLNKGNFHFDDVTGASGITQDSLWSTGVVLADINHDGWLDIYVCNSGHMTSGHRRNRLYINNHNLTFTESAAQYGLDISAYTTQVSFFDYDGDGDLDCFMINNSPIPVNTLNNSNRRDLPDKDWPVEPFLKGGGDHLYRNDKGHFTEVTREAGIHGSLISFGLGVSVGDVNGDDLPDVFVSNDSYERDYLYINQGNGTFRDELESRLGHSSFSSMGADVADINNDGFPEIFTTDMLPEDDYRLKTLGAFDNIDLYNAKLKSGFSHQYVKNCLQLNNGTGHFLDIANFSGVSASDWSWGALFFDMDNDGYNDIYVCNGVNKDVTNLDFMDFFANEVYQKMVMSGKKKQSEEILTHVPVHPMLHKAFRNMGDLSFSDQGKFWGFTQPSFSNGAAYGDLDNDGDLDLVINNENGPAFLYRNHSNDQLKNHFCSILLEGSGDNRFAIGSKIHLYANGQTFYRELVPSRGFQSSMDYRQIIGLGKIGAADSVVITWPDRHSTVIDHPELDKPLYISEEKAVKRPGQPSAGLPVNPLATEQAAVFTRHPEDNNIDFYYEYNVPKMMSREGPRASTGDINGDGMEDIVIGGTAGSPASVYLQNKSGGYDSLSQPGLRNYQDFEDGAVLLFDADRDGDLDLFIGPGGNNNQGFSRQMQLRLFLNDGKGHFAFSPALPNVTDGANTVAAVAGDFNGDGYADLFVGGLSVPREYGVVPASRIYINDGKGHFNDIAPSLNPEIAHIGMITSAAWADVTGDGRNELIVAGEWMTPRIFTFEKDRFREIHTGLEQLFGWWEHLQVTDLNGDGKPDLVLGNIGENFYLRPDSARPVKLWIADFDHNGNPEAVLTRTVDGRDMTVFLKHDMEIQIPMLKKQNLKHDAYARKSIQELFSSGILDTVPVKKFNYCSSVVAINEGNGKFSIRKLPTAVQMSSLNATAVVDVNGDGKPDLLTGGNEFGFLPQFGRLDASYGDVLLNDGKGNFTVMPNRNTGMNLTGQVRDMKVLKGGDKKRVVYLINDEAPRVFEYGQKINDKPQAR